ncbi:copper resistance protein NlpE [Chitinophaga sp. 30R24]|uniref:copper resistance protein NlpE n=1 Tax=Chitinophaga sp. 30R24 TaxID=3248838 RepID=UPI003B90681D
MKHLPLLLACVAFAVACRHSGKSTAADSTATTMATDTATWVTYSGTLPCGDCEGIVTELALQIAPNSNHHFTLKETYEGKNQTLPSEGIFTVLHNPTSNPSATIILLNPDKDKNLQRYFQQVNENEIKLLDAEQKVIENNLNYTLKKVL